MQIQVVRSVRLFVAAATALALLTFLATSSALAAETKTFTGLKNCGTFPTPPTCIMTAASLRILRGAVVNYTAPVFYLDHLASPVTLRAIDRRGSTATGQCAFYFAGPSAGTGHCEYWSGTGKLAGFHAAISVAATSTTSVYSLAGTYWFDRHDDDDNDSD
jgi:hypothetical protein